MANFYVKKIENTGEASTVNSATNSSDGAVLKTNTQVGIFNKSGNNFYVNGVLNSAQGKVFDQNAGTNYMPTRSNLASLIQKETVKSVFNKFFTNSSNTSDESHNTSASADGSSNWSSAVNLNAFAYMRTNGVKGYKF